MAQLPITRGIVFFSKTASMTLAGQSGKRYHFKNSEKTAPVINAIDIKFFRTHPDLREEGKPQATAAELAAKKRPVSYTETGKTARTFPPPSQHQLDRAERRRDLFNDAKKKEADGVSAKGLAKEGVGTKDSQDLRALNAKISAGDLSATTAPMADQTGPPKKKVAVEVKPAPVLKQVDETPDNPVETEPAKPAVPVENAEVSKSQCRYCGRKLHNQKGRLMHENRWCKKNPDSPEYNPDA